jgi:EAL domain-containing protein (putative c-di-GMP-specific phosphodiesterase class I)
VIAEKRPSLDLQPLVDLETGRWGGFEALVRWPDPTCRRSPADFLPLAEETGLIVPLGAWVLATALDWLAAWPDAAAGVSVNVAGRQVADPGFTDLVRAELERTGVTPGRLTLEVTEQTAVEDLTRASAVLQPLRALGVHVSLDDFGTGFSSLGYLARLPVDELKIDRSFVAGLGARSHDDALVRAVLGMAADLGLRVVAEGVETAERRGSCRTTAARWCRATTSARPSRWARCGLRRASRSRPPEQQNSPHRPGLTSCRPPAELHGRRSGRRSARAPEACPPARDVARGLPSQAWPQYSARRRSPCARCWPVPLGGWKRPPERWSSGSTPS